MNTLSRIAVGGLASALIVQAASANSVLIVNDTFDTYANQAAFQAVWAPIGTSAPQSAQLTIDAAQAKSPPNSVTTPGVATNGTSRNRLTFAESGNAVGPGYFLVWSFDFFDTYDPPNSSPQRNYANLQDTITPGGTNQLVSLGLNNNQTGANSGGNYYMARILGYAPTAVDPNGGPNESVTGSGAYFKLNDFGVGLRSQGWHNLKVVMSSDDGLSTDYAFYVDDQLAELVLNVGTAASIRSFDNITIGSGLSNGNTGARFDNMRLEFVTPLPSAALAGLALITGLAARRRERSPS